MPVEFEKRALFPRFRPTVDTNIPRKQSFSKTLFQPEEFENTGFVFSVHPKYFEKEAFWKRWGYDNHDISLLEF